jgi:hypothetical protein
MGDINQRQKICLTPIDEHRRLLQTKPKDWNEIKYRAQNHIQHLHTLV